MTYETIQEHIKSVKDNNLYHNEPIMSVDDHIKLLIQSHISTLTAYKERLEGKLENATTIKEFMNECRYNECLWEEISHLEEIISKLKELIK